jgi:hypothetical protein
VGAKPAGFCIYRHFHGPSAGCRQLLEEFDFGLLHTLGSFGIADRSSDALKDGDAESLA